MFTTLLAGIAMIATTPGSSTADRCASPDTDRVTARPERALRARPLTEMPPARQVLTVYRRVPGCPVILVRDGDRIVEEPVDKPDRRSVFKP